MSPPVCLVIPSASPAPMTGRTSCACHPRGARRVTWPLPKSAAALRQTAPRLGSKRGTACEGTVAAAPHPVKERGWGGAASPLDDDEVLRVLPEAGGGGALYLAPHRAARRRRGGEKARGPGWDDGGLLFGG